MTIRLPKPDIKCPQCGHKIDDFSIDGLTADTITIYSDCGNCGADVDINVKFEEDPKICDCEICKKIKAK